MVNQVNIIGRLTRDPESISTTKGSLIGKFGVATDSGYGEYKSTLFMDCTVFGNTVGFLTEHCKKGDLVYVTGELRLESWESKDGEKHSKTVIVANRVQKLNGSSDSTGSKQPYEKGKKSFNKPAAKNPASKIKESYESSGDIDDDDVPF